MPHALCKCTCVCVKQLDVCQGNCITDTAPAVLLSPLILSCHFTPSIKETHTRTFTGAHVFFTSFSVINTQTRKHCSIVLSSVCSLQPENIQHNLLNHIKDLHASLNTKTLESKVYALSVPQSNKMKQMKWNT